MNKVGCKVYINGKWRRGTLEWLKSDPPSFKESSKHSALGWNSNSKKAPSSGTTGWTSNSPQFSPQEFTTSNEIQWEWSKGVNNGELMENGIKITPDMMINTMPPKEESLTPKQNNRLRAAAFYQRLYFWGMVIGFIGGGWLSPYVKSAIWHVGQFLVSLK